MTGPDIRGTLRDIILDMPNNHRSEAVLRACGERALRIYYRRLLLQIPLIWIPVHQGGNVASAKARRKKAQVARQLGVQVQRGESVYSLASTPHLPAQRRAELPAPVQA